ncbi:hypothetical protein [Cupriavidus plantarum]|nr:hypothetical protein [Cupriavidus plantarum]REE93428.1 hypothetical protein C7418_2194 [Cupriavidus plantarum]RLK38860.1 hypothetical protein C7417_2384 [Cupriavidus plantarum]CAG2136849.1 hypothetical protein LMG26296_02433 [Cupriavidus plantarum]SMR84809.1 hypothetical protein SAMN05421735_3602 [Cupriavidus plantarum]
MTLSLYDGAHVAADLERIRSKVPEDADLLDAFLNEVAESQHAIWALSRWQAEHPDPLFSVRAIDCCHADGYNVYRIRPLKLLWRYRVLYAFDAPMDEFHVLAIVSKKHHDAPAAIDADSYGYEPTHPISQRVRDEYDLLRIPRLP